MNILRNLLKSAKEENRVVCVEAETDEESLRRGVELLNKMYPSDQYEKTQEDEFYCGLCKGWSKISTFPHNH